MIPRALKRLLHRATLKDPAYRFLFAPGPPGEAVVFDCETTGLDWRRDDICSIAAVRIKGDRILTSERFEAMARPRAEMRAESIKVHLLRESDVEIGAPIETVIPRFLTFIGGRPLVGYYLEFDVGMVNKYLRGLLGIELPNPMIEVSKLYYERKYGDAPPGSVIDLSFRAILNDLDLPALDQHDAFNDALMTGMMYLKLRDLKERGVRIARTRDVKEPQTTLA